MLVMQIQFWLALASVVMGFLLLRMGAAREPHAARTFRRYVLPSMGLLVVCVAQYMMLAAISVLLLHRRVYELQTAAMMWAVHGLLTALVTLAVGAVFAARSMLPCARVEYDWAGSFLWRGSENSTANEEPPAENEGLAIASTDSVIAPAIDIRDAVLAAVLQREDAEGFVPEAFFCPVSRSLMLQPTSLPCGHTFDYSTLLSTHQMALERSTWEPDGAGRCPLCKIPLRTPSSWSTNWALRSAIEQWLREEGPRLRAVFESLDEATPLLAQLR
jgi:hypothetical protein